MKMFFKDFRTFDKSAPIKVALTTTFAFLKLQDQVRQAFILI